MPSVALSFRTRLTLRWTIAFSCILAAASAAIFIGIRQTSYSALDRQLRTLAGTELTSAFDRPSAPPHLHDLPITALAGGTFTEKIVQLFDDAGTLVEASPDDAATARLVSRDDITNSLAGQVPVRTVDVDGRPVRLVVLRTTADQRTYAIVVGVVIEDLVSSLNRVAWLLLLVWIGSTIATTVLGFALATTALKPVRMITERAMDIARSGQRATLEPGSTDDEIGRMTRALNALLAQLHAALDANRRFAADAAHELRSPVTAMSGEIEVALRRPRSADEYRVALDVVQHGLGRLTELMNDLMVLVRAQDGGNDVRLQELPLAPALRASVSRYASLAFDKQVRIEMDMPEALVVYAEPRLLDRVFDNVIENAIRYNRHSGSIRLRASYVPPRATGWESGTALICVEDTGPGIAAAERERVFDRFYRIDASRNRHTGGSGLGLAIAREVLAVFKGSIRIGASSSAGTTVEIVIPGRLQESVAAAASSANARSASIA